MGFETNVQALESADVEVSRWGSVVGWLVIGSMGFCFLFFGGGKEKDRKEI